MVDLEERLRATTSKIALDKFLIAGSAFSHLLSAKGGNDQGLIVGYRWMRSVGYKGAFVAVPK